MKSLSDCYTLANGVGIPCIGYGTWKTPDEESGVLAVKEALLAGYRHLDCAAMYGNERSVGEGIRLSGVDRRDIFITSKVWKDNRSYDKAMASFEKTCKDLNVDYLDLLLIHWPASSSEFSDWEEINLDTWRAFIDLYKDKRLRAIGVSNFMPHHLDALMKTEVAPMVDQIEFHPGLMWPETYDYCKKHNIMIEGWRPLGQGSLLNNEVLLGIAKKYGKTVAQICIKWALMHGIVPLPKTVTKLRMEENAEVFDFEISDEDMKAIDAMEGDGASGEHPDSFDK